MAQAFGDRFYVELQRHGSPAEALVEPELVRWAYNHDAPLVATNDVYYGAPAMYEAHDALLCIADGSFIGEEKRRRVTPEHWFKPARADARVVRRPAGGLRQHPGHRAPLRLLVPKRDPVLPRISDGGGTHGGGGAGRAGPRGAARAA
jgi:DNA polymerase-3 subunit alpha